MCRYLDKVECRFEEVLAEIYDNLSSGLLLASVGEDGEKNIMAIGLGLVGILFGKPVFMVAVLPSRHTYKLLNETGVFTVNIPGEGMGHVIDFCGTKSGRDHDKFKELNLTAKRGRMVEAPIVDECEIHLECKVITTTDVTEGVTYRRLYYGEVLKTYRGA